MLISLQNPHASDNGTRLGLTYTCPLLLPVCVLPSRKRRIITLRVRCCGSAETLQGTRSYWYSVYWLLAIASFFEVQRCRSRPFICSNLFPTDSTRHTFFNNPWASTKPCFAVGPACRVWITAARSPPRLAATVFPISCSIPNFKILRFPAAESMVLVPGPRVLAGCATRKRGTVSVLHPLLTGSRNMATIGGPVDAHSHTDKSGCGLWLIMPCLSVILQLVTQVFQKTGDRRVAGDRKKIVT